MSANKKHQKHTKLQQPQWGSFGRNELAIIGSTCTTIGELSSKITDKLSPNHKISYVDAEHSDNSKQIYNGLLYTEGEQNQQFSFKNHLNEYHIKSLFNKQDLVLLNGNHFRAESQIVIIDSRKPLEEKVDQLTDVKLIILYNKGETSIPEVIKKSVANFESIPVYAMDEIHKITTEIEKLIQQAIPSLSGLVLAGGKSTRMHTDKTKLEYHDKPQRIHLYEQLGNYCEKVFISCREKQAKEIPDPFNTICDSFLDMGPMGALLSAFRQNPNTAWLSVACDLPLLSSKTLEYLVKHRDSSKMATAFNSPNSDFPEPLITIWEPKSYSVLLHFLSLGFTCPRKALINSDIALLDAPSPDELTNVNRPEEYKEAKKALATGL